MRDFGEPISLSDESFVAAETVICWGVFRLFVTGDWPDGDREPRYFRTDDDDESSVPDAEFWAGVCDV